MKEVIGEVRRGEGERVEKGGGRRGDLFLLLGVEGFMLRGFFGEGRDLRWVSYGKGILGEEWWEWYSLSGFVFPRGLSFGSN